MTKYSFLQSLWLLCVCVAMVTYANEGHGHNHEHTGPNPTSFNDPKITQDEAHLKEHLKDEINTNAKMTPEQMEFHYFRLHDTNNDTHLDGTEILQAMSHMMPVPELELHEKLGKSKEQIEAMKLERQQGMAKYYEEMIDRVLIDDDVDKDGYLTYSEFIRARRRDEYHQRRMHEDRMRTEEQMQFQQFQQFQAMQAQQQGNQNGQFRPTVSPPPGNGAPQQQQQHIQQQGQQQHNMQQHGQQQGQGQHQQQQQFQQTR